ncbi:IucA/IucC family C-terminal-domain containing protein [Streptomyces yaizuensis]|uniref:(2Fe-2S)-binding protein n=1 Tax=Streptomyces yaizuensis TaxID=2989713 RepID=A0ABQ5NR81_9ACTN|nr:IucA/IucC family C-terminal-domain containing protein [Streptomyces sp. YSPA8]GLF92767.1 (2Fe-2S)-binding protein [Streptomyces sp. YSPA8]
MDLRELCSMGGFFALRTSADAPPEPGGAGDGTPRPPADDRDDTPRPPAGDGDGTPRPPAGSAPLALLHAGDLTPLTRRVDLVAARHEPRERRVAASIAQLGLAARLWSIALGCAALHGRVPELDPARLYWSPLASTPDDLWLDCSGGGPRTLPATVDTLRATVQDTHLVPLAAALRQDTRIAERLLWGNAGSALAGAVRQLDTWAREHRRPEVAGRAAALAAGLFTGPGLVGTVRGPALRRTTCCLYYRAPRGGLCGDCVFDRPPAHGRP